MNTPQSLPTGCDQYAKGADPSSSTANNIESWWLNGYVVPGGGGFGPAIQGNGAGTGNACVMAAVCGATLDRNNGPEDLIDSSWANDCNPKNTYIFPYSCWESVPINPSSQVYPFVSAYQDALQAANTFMCPYVGQNGFPLSYGSGTSNTSLQPVAFVDDWNQEPMRVVLDAQANFIDNCSGDQNYPAFNPKTNCAGILNGNYPGCSLTDSRGCQWTALVTEPECGYQWTDQCGFAATFCYKTAADQSYKRDCCMQTLFSRSDIGSNSIYFTPRTWLNRDFQSVSDLAPWSQTLYNSISNNSYSVNPYQVYCDPQWCPGSPICDDILFLECQYSTTFNQDGSRIHATLANDGICAQWWTNIIDFGLLSNHNFSLIDQMVNAYCINSASQLSPPDTLSCQCVLPDGLPNSSSNFLWGSCSQVYGDASLPVPPQCTDGPDSDRRPFVAINVASDGVISIEDYVCSNMFCQNKGNGAAGRALITSDVLVRQQSCPESVCQVLDLTRSLTVNDIAGASYVNIFNFSVMCGQNSITGQEPPYSVLTPFSNIWFVNTNTNPATVLNPDTPGNFIIRNDSVDTNLSYDFTYSNAFPNWLTQSVITNGSNNANPANPLPPGQFSSINFSIVPENITGPTSFMTTVTVFALDTSQPQPYPTFSTGFTHSTAIMFNVIAANPQNPPAPLPPTPKQNNGLPSVSVNFGSASNIALIVLGVACIIFAIYLWVNQSTNLKTAERAVDFMNKKLK